jgi:MYXO-CTERM domain-containing protein
MKTRSRKKLPLKIPSSRWLAYASASAATALTGASSVEAEIHYSGRVDVAFPPDENKSVALQLEEPGNSIFFAHTINGGSNDFFGAAGLNSGAFAGSYPGFEYAFVWRLKNRNRYVSHAHFTNGGFGFGTSGTMVRGDRSSQNWKWSGKGTDFVGFRFNNGSGIQYGWARVRMDGAASRFSFTVLDYAWADSGEPIKAGQTSSSEANTPSEGSLGLLALGAAGVAAWRQRRKRASD